MVAFFFLIHHPWKETILPKNEIKWWTADHSLSNNNKTKANIDSLPCATHCSKYRSWINFCYPYYNTTRGWIIFSDLRGPIQNTISSILLSESEIVLTEQYQLFIEDGLFPCTFLLGAYY